MRLLFNNFYSQEFDDIENAVFFYLVEIPSTQTQGEQNSSKLYKISALSRGTLDLLDKLRADPQTRAKFFWLIPRSSVVKIANHHDQRNKLFRHVDNDDVSNLPEAYRDIDLTTQWIIKESPLDTEEIKLLFNFDPKQCEPEEFDPAPYVPSSFATTIVSLDEFQLKRNILLTNYKNKLLSNDDVTIQRTLASLRLYTAIHRSAINPLLISYMLPAFIDLFQSENVAIKNEAVSLFAYLIASIKDYWDYCDRALLQAVFPVLLKFVMSSTIRQDSIEHAIQSRTDRLKAMIEAANDTSVDSTERVHNTQQTDHAEESNLIIRMVILDMLLTLTCVERTSIELENSEKCTLDNPECVLMLVELIKNHSVMNDAMLILTILVDKRKIIQDMFRDVNGVMVLIESFATNVQNKSPDLLSHVSLLDSVIKDNEANIRLICSYNIIPLLMNCSQSEDNALRTVALRVLVSISEYHQDTQNLLTHSELFITTMVKHYIETGEGLESLVELFGGNQLKHVLINEGKIPFLIEHMQGQNDTVKSNELKVLKLIYEDAQSTEDTVYGDLLKNYDTILDEISEKNVLTHIVDQIKMNLIALSRNHIPLESFIRNIDNINLKLSDLKPDEMHLFSDKKNKTVYQEIKRQTMQLIDMMKNQGQIQSPSFDNTTNKFNVK